MEARLDDLSLRTLIKENGEMKEINAVRRRGIGVTAYWRGVVGFSYTAQLRKDALKECVGRSVSIARSSQKIAKLAMEFEGRTAKNARLRLKYRKHPKDVSLSEKKRMIDIATKIAHEKAENVSSIMGAYGELSGEKYFVNSDDWG